METVDTEIIFPKVVKSTPPSNQWDKTLNILIILMILFLIFTVIISAVLYSRKRMGSEFSITPNIMGM